MLDAYPIGYAKDVSNSTGSYYYNGAVEAFLGYGYSESQRRAYLRTEHVDPADMEDDSLRTKVSLREVLSDAWAPGQPFVKWQQTKGIWMHDSLLDLVNGLAKTGCPIFLSGQPIKKHIPPYGQTYLFSWSPGSELPTNKEDYIGTDVAKASDLAAIAIKYDENPDRIGRVATNVASQLAKSGKPVVLDFSTIPPSKLESVLKEWLKK